MPMPAEAQGWPVLLKNHILCLDSRTGVSIDAGLQQCGRGGSEAVWTRSQSQGLNRSGGMQLGASSRDKSRKMGRNREKVAKGRAGPLVGFWLLRQAGRAH